MIDDDKALVETVRLEAEINKNYDSIAYRLLTRIADRIEALSAEKEAARMEERDAIVAWLRETSDIFHDEISVSRKRDTSELLHHAQSCSRAAKAIEAGEHLK